jgi:nitrite reductase/ring-hydroxylating ferredoxin subunit
MFGNAISVINPSLRPDIGSRAASSTFGPGDPICQGCRARQQPYHVRVRHGSAGKSVTVIDVAGEGDVPVGAMVHVEAAGREVLLANVGGRFNAMSDRCSHEGAQLSLGRLDGTVVTCPAHGSRFDVTTGRNLSGPVMADLPGLEQLSPRARAMAREKAAEMASVRVSDLPVYRVTVENGRVLVDV